MAFGGGFGAAGQGVATGAMGGMAGPWGMAQGGIAGGMAGGMFGGQQQQSPWGQQSGYLNNIYGQGQGLYGQQPNQMMSGLMSAYQQGIGSPQPIGNQPGYSNGNPDWMNRAYPTDMIEGPRMRDEARAAWESQYKPGVSGADLGPWGASIGQTPEQVAAANNPAVDPTAPPVSATSPLEDIYNNIAGGGSDAGRYDPNTGNLISGPQITPGTELPYLQQMQEQGKNLYGRQHRFMAAGQGAAQGMNSGNPWGNIMKSLRGNRQGALMSQFGMPRRGGNALGTAGQGAAKSMAPWEAQQNAIAGQYYGGQGQEGPWGQQSGYLNDIYGRGSGLY